LSPLLGNRASTSSRRTSGRCPCPHIGLLASPQVCDIGSQMLGGVRRPDRFSLLATLLVVMTNETRNGLTPFNLARVDLPPAHRIASCAVFAGGRPTSHRGRLHPLLQSGAGLEAFAASSPTDAKFLHRTTPSRKTHEPIRIFRAPRIATLAHRWPPGRQQSPRPGGLHPGWNATAFVPFAADQVRVDGHSGSNAPHRHLRAGLRAGGDGAYERDNHVAECRPAASGSRVSHRPMGKLARSGVTRFRMALGNARLGVCLPNPAKARRRFPNSRVRSSPPCAPISVRASALSAPTRCSTDTTVDNDFLCTSTDGGHFENLGSSNDSGEAVKTEIYWVISDAERAGEVRRLHDPRPRPIGANSPGERTFRIEIRIEPRKMLSEDGTKFVSPNHILRNDPTTPTASGSPECSSQKNTPRPAVFTRPPWDVQAFKQETPPSVSQPTRRATSSTQK